MLTRNASWPGPNHGTIVASKPKNDGKTLLAEVEAFAARHRLTASGVCLRATGNGSLIDKLREGTTPRPVTVEKVRRYMRSIEGKD